MAKHIECEHCSEDKYLYKTSIGWLCAEHAASLLDEKVSRLRELEAENAELKMQVEQAEKSISRITWVQDGRETYCRLCGIPYPNHLLDCVSIEAQS